MGKCITKRERRVVASFQYGARIDDYSRKADRLRMKFGFGSKELNSCGRAPSQPANQPGVPTHVAEFSLFRRLATPHRHDFRIERLTFRWWPTVSETSNQLTKISLSNVSNDRISMLCLNGRFIRIHIYFGKFRYIGGSTKFTHSDIHSYVFIRV